MTLPQAATQPDWPEGATLLLGIGAQKAGTSWVHAMLRAHPACVWGPLKELHYFDTVFGLSASMPGKRQRLSARLAAEGQADSLRGRKLAALDRALAQPDAAHVGYQQAVTLGLEPGQVALDFTPAYGRLGDEGFRAMAGLGGATAGRVGFLYLMREPVARLWSALRMAVAKRQGDAGFEPACRAALDAMIAEGSEALVAQGNYAETLARLQAQVPAARRLVLFFETLFTQVSLDRIHDFLGIARRPLTDAEPRNTSRTAAMRSDQVARLTEIFRPQYDAICATFGEAVPDAWHRRFAPSAAAA